MADFVHIHEDSVFHGLDRCFATFTMVRCLAVGAVTLEPCMLMMAALPILCFVKGRDAKALPAPSAWIFWHTLWHLSGGLLVLFGTWRMYANAAHSSSRLDAAWAGVSA